MQKYENRLRTFGNTFKEKEKTRLLTSVLSVLIWGMIAHGYRFCNLLLSHDSLKEFYMFGDSYYSEGTVTAWKISLGRFFEPIYDTVFRGPLALPWVAGILSLIWLSLAMWLLTKIFDLSSRLMIFLISGFLTVNITITATAATYVHDLDAYLFALLAAVLAVYCWKFGSREGGDREGRDRKLGNLKQAVPGCGACVALLVMTLGIYQSMISAFIALVLMVSILQLLDGAEAKPVVLNGLKAVGVLLAAAVLYLLCVKISCSLTNVTLGSGYNSIRNMANLENVSIIIEIVNACKYCVREWFIYPSMWNPIVVAALNLGFIGIGAAGGFILWLDKKVSLISKGWIVVLVALLPLGMNISFVLNLEDVHQLMLYAFWLIYVFVMLILRKFRGGDRAWPGNLPVKAIAVVLALIILWGNALTANTLYVKKDLEDEATLTVMENVVERIEDFDGYVPGKTEVAIIGVPDVDSPDAFAPLQSITGAQSASPITQIGYYPAYFEYVLQKNVELSDFHTVLKLQKMQEVKSMPAYPSEECMQMIDGILVVKMQ